MPVLDDLKASVSQLSADVQAYIAKQQPPADSVSAADAEAIIAQLQAIDALVNPPAAPAA